LLNAGLSPTVDVLFTELTRVIPEHLRSDAVKNAREMLENLLTSSSNKCSMLQDVTARRRTEIDFLTGLIEKRLRDVCPTAAAVTDLVRALSPDVMS